MSNRRSEKSTGWLLVIVQFAAIGYLILTCNIHHLQSAASLLVIVGFGIGLWAVLSMRQSKLRILPDPAKEAVLVSTGPYQFIRHPMYTAVLLTCMGFVVNATGLASWLVWLLLFLVLNLKIRLEERLLNEKFQEYKEYTKRTKCLLPFFW